MLVLGTVGVNDASFTFYQRRFVDGGRAGTTVLMKDLLQITLDGRVSVLRRRPNEWHVYPIASPDGTSLAFAVMIFSGNAMLLEDF